MSKAKKGTKYVTGKVDLIHVNVATQQYFDSNNKPIKIKSEEARQQDCKFNSVKKTWLSPSGETLQYNVTILIPKDSKEAKKIKTAADEEWEKGKAAKVIKKSSRYPIQDGDEMADELEAKEKNGEYYRGNYVIKAKSNYKPMIVLGKKIVKPTTDSFDIDHNGWIGRVSIRFDYYSGMGGGITTRLNQICFLEDNLDLDFGGGCDFEIEEEEESTDFGNSKSVVGENDTAQTMSCYDDDEEEPPAI
jgi:hypothetical protein